MKRILFAAVLLLSCAVSNAQGSLTDMSLRQKVGKMFVVRLESLNGMVRTTELSQEMVQKHAEYPCGGICLFAHDIVDPQQLVRLTESIHALNGHPLIYIDEEGGRVARIANNPAFNLPKYQSAAAIASSHNPMDGLRAGCEIGSYLKHYGIDVDLAPVADVNTNPQNVVIGTRAFSDDPSEAAEFVVAFLDGLDRSGITGCLKHFPGHGDTNTDSHLGYAESHKTWEELSECEMITFRAGIEAGAKMIMTAHVAVPAVTGSNIPSTLSSDVLSGILRDKLGFKGVIITDSIEMGAISNVYEPGEAAILAILAGADIILTPGHYEEAFDAVVQAVESGRIPEERIDESVKRILCL